MTVQKMTPKQCRDFLKQVISDEIVEMVDLAKALDCSIATITRIVAGQTRATEEMCDRVQKWLKGQNKSPEVMKIASVVLGSAAMGGLGLQTAVVAAAATYGGLSAAGISSGLATAGGTMAGGVGAAVAGAALPVTAGLAGGAALGYGLYRGVKWLFTDDKTYNEDFNPELEEYLQLP